MPVFAYTSAISRILKSGTISKEDVEELLSSKNFQELLAVLYERKLVTKEGLNAPGPVLANLKETALLKLKGLSSMSRNSKFVADVVDAYVGLLAMDELESAISYAFSLERGNPARAFARQNLTLIRGVESISTVQSLINLVSNSSRTLASALNEALNKAGKESSPSVISNLVEALILRRLYVSTVSLRGDWQGPIKKILCGYADYFALSTAFALRNAVMEGCTVGDEVKDAATGNPSLLYEAIRKTELGKHVKSERPLDALNELRVLARRNARRAAYLAFQGSPFTPATAVAVAELIRLDYQDLVAIVTGIDARLPRDKIASLLSFELL